MPTLCLRSIITGKNAKLGSYLITSSGRFLSTSAARFQEEAQAERPKGVPLATDLGGVKVKPNTNKRPGLAEKLLQRRAELAKAKAGNQTSSGEKNSTTNGGERVSFQRPNSQANGRPPFQANRRPGQPGSSSSQRPRRSGNSREGGAQGQANRSQQQQRKRRVNGRSKSSIGSRNGRENADPDLDDYAGEYGGGAPRRIYDDSGLLRLKGKHAQLCQTIKPALPKLTEAAAVVTESSSSLLLGSGQVTNSLRILPYSDRAAPKKASEPTRNVLGTVDNAEHALSRVKDVTVPVRRDILGVVRKFTENIPPRNSSSSPALKA